MAGWVKIQRSLRTHQLWSGERFTKGQAWADMIMAATYEASVISRKGVSVHLQRGDVPDSEVALAKRWSWSRNKVRRFMEHLMDQGMIQKVSRGKSRICSCINITNYDKHQVGTTKTEQETEQETCQESAQQTAQQTAPIQEDKEVKKKRNNKNTVTTQHINVAERVFEIALMRRDQIKTDKKISDWGNTIRLMVERDGVEIEKINPALDWYSSHWNDEFIPVIESAKALREKWTKLLNAIDRAKEQKPQTGIHNGFDKRDYRAGATKVEDLPSFLR